MSADTCDPYWWHGSWISNYVNYYLSQWWPRSLSPYGVTRPHCVTVPRISCPATNKVIKSVCQQGSAITLWISLYYIIWRILEPRSPDIIKLDVLWTIKLVSTKFFLLINAANCTLYSILVHGKCKPIPFYARHTTLCCNVRNISAMVFDYYNMFHQNMIPFIADE